MSDNAVDGDDAPEPTALSRAIELCVFAPMGVAMTVAEDLPSLITKGRQRVELEISNARVIGKFVVDAGQRDLTTRLGSLLGRSPAAPVDGQADDEAPSAAVPVPSSPKPAPDPAADAIVERALADYETLSASQVVRRLESLGPDELRAVQRHEASHRNRRTILNRATQLLDGAEPPHPPE